jgi:competence protein CoiA
MMKYANVDGEKSEAFPKGRGKCILCEKDVMAKCGNVKVHHWSHINLKHCDNWWENETDWHRKWKSHFPIEWQEVVHIDLNTGEKHIADVKSSTGLIFEFQNSPITLDELSSREKFYKKMIWVVNGEKFANNFHILGKLPNQNLEEFKDIAFMPTEKEYLGRGFYRYSENPDHEDPSSFVLIHPFKEIQESVNKFYVGHHLFDWTKYRNVWFKAESKVFLDFGDNLIWRLMKYDTKLWCVRKFTKEAFIRRALETTNYT